MIEGIVADCRYCYKIEYSPLTGEQCERTVHVPFIYQL